VEILNVGYIGLGNIGKPSALRLITEAYRVHVFDLCQPSVDELVDKGAVGCSSVAELTAQCGHIGICVRDDQQASLGYSTVYSYHGVLGRPGEQARYSPD